MNTKYDDMKDENQDKEFKLLGNAEWEMSPSQKMMCMFPEDNGSQPPQQPKRHRWVWWLLAVVLVIVLIVIGVVLGSSLSSEENESLVDKVLASRPVQTPEDVKEWLIQSEQNSCVYETRYTVECRYDSALCSMRTDTVDTLRVLIGQRSYTAIKEVKANELPVRIFYPLNATPHLDVGLHCLNDTINNILFFQAADVRADNGGIVGAFVKQGKPLSWGLSKKGYCAILENEVTIGVAENSPLFEKATEMGGDFFRQYPLVDNGVMVENSLELLSLRRALCELEGRIVAVESTEVATLDNFARTLVSLGVKNAIYLTGGVARGWYIPESGVGERLGIWNSLGYKNTSFIIWSPNGM